jgi:hypothetical protein
VHVDKSIVIRAAPSAVFPWLAPLRQPLWDKSLVRADGEGGLHQVHRTLGHRFEMQAEADVDPDRRFAWHQTEGDYEAHAGAFTLERIPEGTKLHLTADVEMPYVMPDLVTEAQIERDLHETYDRALFTLKELVERGKAHGS